MKGKAAVLTGKFQTSINMIPRGMKRFFYRIGSIGYAPGDSDELKSHKTILTIGLYVSILNLITYFPVYIIIGRIHAAITLLALAIVFTLNLIVFSITRNFSLFRNATFIILYFYIIIYHTVMGGYIGSTGYINYGIAALNGILIFYKSNWVKNVWFIIYLITAIVLYFLQPIISKSVAPLSDSLNTIMFVNNFILISGMVMLSANYFLNIIRKEKLKSDLLIRNILPESVVNELYTTGRSHPILVPAATTIFMDFVGFTRISHSMSPEQLVNTLNDYFTCFDIIFREHKVEKLKTIGDGYMAVAGVPQPNNTHPVDMALAAMKIILHMQSNKDAKTTDWNIRIGIHTGAMIAGIIGESKFSYDVWGDSVNLCSRLETASKPGFINVSHQFMEYTSDFFEFERRGLIEIKNSDPVLMYFLVDIKEELRLEHFCPNQRFYKLYDEYARLPFAGRQKAQAMS